EDMYGEVLNIILSEMSSKYGIFGYLNEKGDLVEPSLSKDVWEECEIQGKDIVFPKKLWSKNIFGRVLFEKRSIIINRPFSVPDGHMVIQNFLGTPIIDKNNVIGVIIVANKETDYSEEDTKTLEFIVNNIAPILNARLQRDRFENQRKKAESKLKESENRLKRFMDSATDGFVLFDSKLNFVEANNVSLRMVELNKEELIGKNILDITPYLQENGRYDKYLNVIKTGKPFSTEDVIFSKQDGMVSSHLSIRAFKVGDNLGVIFTDITEGKKADQRLKESEEKWRALSENSPAHVMMLDREHKIIFINRTVPDLSKEEVIGTSIYNYTPQKFHKVTRDCYNSVWETGEPSSITTKYITKEGDISYFDIRVGPVFQSGKVVALISHSIDITERKKKEEEIQLQSKIIENMSEGVYLIKFDDGTITFTNPAFEEMFGYNPGEIIGKNVAIVNAPTDKAPEEIREEIMGILKDTGEWHGEVLNIKKDGRSFWCYANVSLFDHPEYGTVIVSVHTDITERKKIEQELKESEENLKTINKAFLKFKDDPLANLQILVDTAGNLLRADSAMYNRLISPNGNEVLKTLAIYQEPPEFIKESDAIGHICTDVIKDNRDEIVIIQDLDKTKYVDSDENIKKYNLKQYVGICIRSKGIPIASLCLVYTKHRIFSESELELLKILTKSASIEVTRLEAMKKLKESEKKLFTLLDGLPAFIYLQAPDYSIRYANQYFQEKFGNNLKRKCYEAFNNFSKPCEDCPTFKVFDTETPQKWEWENLKGEIYQIYDYPFKGLDGTSLILELGIDITERKQAEQRLKESEHDLDERVKELTCLYELSKLVENPVISHEDILNSTLNLIPPAFQFPDITTARITYNGREYKRAGYEETEWKLSTLVEINEKPLLMEIYYLEDKPFLKEEHELINEIGIRLKTTFEEKEVQKKLHLSEDKYRTLFESSVDGI
ncbi:hypothetical protein LCGC14_1745890, partial [marine sediment metagenome]